MAERNRTRASQTRGSRAAWRSEEAAGRVASAAGLETLRGFPSQPWVQALARRARLGFSSLSPPKPARYEECLSDEPMRSVRLRDAMKTRT